MNNDFHPDTNTYKHWTIEEELKLEQLVSTGKNSFKEIGKILNRTGQSCQSHSKILGFDNNYIHKKYTVNENFWETPNIINSSYAGFSAADCYIEKRSENSFGYRLEIQKSDENFLKQFIKDCEFTGPIKESIRLDKNSHTVRFNVNSNKWAADLNQNFNIYPQKTHRLEPPNFSNKNLLFAWLIGYTSGDGTIHYIPSKNQLMIGYVSSSEKMIKWLSEFIPKEFPQQLRKRPNNYYKNKKYNCWHYSVNGLRACVMVDYLRRFEVPKLDRKWNNPKVLRHIEEMKIKYPNLFPIQTWPV